MDAAQDGDAVLGGYYAGELEDAFACLPEGDKGVGGEHDGGEGCQDVLHGPCGLRLARACARTASDVAKNIQ